MMLPELWPGEHFARELVHQTKRRAIAPRRQHRAACEIDAKSQHGVARLARLLYGSPNGPRGTVEPIARMLKSKLRRKSLASRRKALDNLAMTVFHHRPTALVPFQIDHQRTNRLRPEVQPEGKSVGSHAVKTPSQKGPMLSDSTSSHSADETT
jgi:hypothetical protein